MNRDTVIRLTDSPAVDWDAPGAAMQLAWVLTAQDCWSNRTFGTDTRELFTAKLRYAHGHVAKIRAARRRDRAAQADARIQQLQAERRQLENRSFRHSIADEQRRIDAQINAIMETL